MRREDEEHLHWKDEQLVVATRLHFANASEERLHSEKISGFVQNTLTFADFVVIAIGASVGTVTKLKEIVANLQPGSGKTRVFVLEVKPWGKFVPALNALLSWAVDRGVPKICYQSLEVHAAPEVVHELLKQVKEDDSLVAGAAFFDDHHFCEGLQVINGRTVPWNTLSIWSVKKLSLTGFLLIAEGQIPSRIPAGVEEVTTISFLQRLLPRKARAKLISHPAMQGDAWRRDFSDEARKEWHRKKMQSKVDRPAAQLEAMPLDPGLVEHILVQQKI